MMKIKRAKLLSFEDEYCFRKPMLWLKREQLFRPSEDAFCQTWQNCENQARKPLNYERHSTKNGNMLSNMLSRLGETCSVLHPLSLF